MVKTWSVTASFQLGTIHKHVHAQSLSCVQLFATPRTVARQVSLFTGFYRQESSCISCIGSWILLALSHLVSPRTIQRKTNMLQTSYIRSFTSNLPVLSFPIQQTPIRIYLMSSLFYPKSFLFIFTWGGQEDTWTVTPQVFTETFYFIQALSQPLKGLHFSCNLVLIKFVLDLLFHSIRNLIKRNLFTCSEP